MTQNRPGHIPELQSLRGIAAVAVMIGHALNYYDTPPWFRTCSLIFNGRAAVVVFFVLSGYVLTRSLRQSSFDRYTVLKFYGQRIFRIYPAIWMASVLGLCYLLVLHWRIPVEEASAGVRHQFRSDRFDILHIIASFAGMLAFVLPQLWSIFVEIVASTVMPLVAFVIWRRPQWSLRMLALAVIASYVIGHATYYNFGLYLIDFVAGATLALPRNRLKRHIRDMPARAVFAVGLSALALTQYLPLEYYNPTAHLIETVISVLLIALLLYPVERITSLSSRFLVFIGDISYSIYLLHYVVLCVIAKLFAILVLLMGINFHMISMSILIAIMTCIWTVPLAWVSFEFVEKPGVELGKRLVAYWGVKPDSVGLASPTSKANGVGLW